MKNKIATISYVIFFVFLSSCASHKKVAYLQDIKSNYTMDIQLQKNAVVQSGDWISIVVNSKDAELAQMFNLPIVSNSMVSNGSYSGSTNKVSGYLVDENGYIDFPQLGAIKIADLTLIELSALIKQDLMNKGYIKDPTVTTQFINFKISVMGEVAHPGTFNVSSERISLLDALSMAGDLTIYGKRDNIKVIREVNGQRTISILDLRNKEFFNSPYFYLRQNDVVYVEPNKIKSGQSEINQNRTVGTFASIISVLISISVLIFK